jgi:hypothetical protein
MSTRLAAISIVSALAIAAPAGASAATAATPSVNPLLLGPWPALQFVPPRVGPISVNIGAIIISGQQVSPGIHFTMPPITMPPIVFGGTH